MRNELLNDNPSIFSFKKDLEACRPERKEAKKAPSATKHLDDYPALKKPQLLAWELECEIGLSNMKIKENWITALPKLIDYFSRLDTNINALAQDHLTILILLKVTDHFKLKRLKKDSHTGHIVQIYPIRSGTTISQTQPKADEPQRLIGIGNLEMANRTYSLYVNEEAIFCGSAIEALI
ncbi:uncharacterized protein LOC117180457 [Belonocnema kinseyi]|uniref:uncharacterized protein LOC117180457 n=1 Tax=Belonocnema kinseyi TaxID=2817044 RepID=UPI00143E039E|nr:uncharacterized protein LOC117180457 [Belonocnema kinseyi]